MRYAIYFTPLPGSRLQRLGAAWFGRDEWSDEAVLQPEELSEITAEPRRYGFHATLKPPFRLVESYDRNALAHAVGALAQRTPQVIIDTLALRPIDGFLALVPREQSPELSALADACVRALDRFREPPSEAERARRRSAGLTPRQESNLSAWGYPYVLEDFRFHMTLTRRLRGDEPAGLHASATSHFATALSQPLVIDALTILREERPGGPFVAEERIPLIKQEMRRAP